MNSLPMDTIAVLDKIGDNIFILDTHLDILFINDHAVNLIDQMNFKLDIKGKEDLIGKNIEILDMDGCETLLNLLYNGPFPTKANINLRYGSSVKILIDRFYIGGELKGYVLTWKDVSEYERELKDIKAALDEFLIVAFTDRLGNITHANEKFCKLSKYTRGELIGRNYKMLRSGYHPDQFFKDTQRYVNKGNLWQGQIMDKAKDGSCYWTQTTIFPLGSNDGKPYQQVVIQTDITEQKRTEEKLQKALKELSDFKFALDQATILGITDNKFKFIYVNDNFCKISKYERHELMGKSPKILSTEPDDLYNKIFDTIGNSQVWRGELKKLAKDGSEYWVEITIVPLLDKDGKPYQFISFQQDITVRKKTEEMLQRTEKLSVIGELAAGLAHEIRNPLTAIKGFAQLIDINTVYKQVIMEEIDRINFIVSEFMVLAKPHAIKFVSKPVIPMINQIVSILESEANLRNVQFEVDLNQSSPLVLCEQNQLKQVFLNLMKNAMEAMPHGGKVHIDLDVIDGMVEISIRDEGVGIALDKIKKLGEPFFTTKEGGNGLGLMVSYNIIQIHGGHVRVESEPNIGTCFTISIPMCKEPMML